MNGRQTEDVLRVNEGAHLSAIESMAERFPLPHNVLGRPGAARYVRSLPCNEFAGWYALLASGAPVAAAHLAPYGSGDGQGHHLWKVRHLLAQRREGNASSWALLLDSLAAQTCSLKPGTSKIVTFIGEHDLEAARAASAAGFTREGCLQDFYRMEEQCLIFGRTVSK